MHSGKRSEGLRSQARGIYPSLCRLFSNRIAGHGIHGGDPSMKAAFESGQDIHAATAAHVFHVEAEAVTEEMRRKAKMVNFGVLYGMSAFGLSQRLGISRKDASEIIDHYWASFPSIKAYMDRTVEQARERGYVETLLGRRRYLPDIQSANGTIRAMAERNAINSPIKGALRT